MKKEQFLPAITTTDKYGEGWRAKIEEIDGLGLERVAVFPTCLEENQREEMYKLLEETRVKNIPLVHLRGDMGLGELDYLIKRYNVKAFNIHTRRQHPVFYDYSRYKDILYLENTLPFDEEELKQFAGVCLDFSHLEDERRLDKGRFAARIELLEKYPIGCNHVSAVPDKGHIDEYNKEIYAMHHFEDLSEFDYLKNYPERYFSDFIAMELENPLEEQLKAIDYILSIL